VKRKKGGRGSEERKTQINSIKLPVFPVQLEGLGQSERQSSEKFTSEED
jgi:hypothetical protein